MKNPFNFRHFFNSVSEPAPMVHDYTVKAIRQEKEVIRIMKSLATPLTTNQIWQHYNRILKKNVPECSIVRAVNVLHNLGQLDYDYDKFGKPKKVMGDRFRRRYLHVVK